MPDVMIDLETMGTRPGSAVLAIAAVAFDARGDELGPEHYDRVTLTSCLESGLTVDADTVEWWLRQVKKVQDALLAQPRFPLFHALKRLTAFVENRHPRAQLRVWGHGATFDVVMLESAYRAVGLTCPWDFRAARDTRTLFELAPYREKLPFEGTAHVALDDAQYQARDVQAAYRALGLSR